MMRRVRNITLAIGFALIWMGSAGAQNLTVEQQCAIAKAQANAAYYKCLSRAQINGIRKDSSGEEMAELFVQCEAQHSKQLENVEARAVRNGRQCTTTGDARDGAIQPPDLDSAEIGEGLEASELAGGKPRIPIRNFEWNGTFKVDSLGVETDLTIRGKWQDGYFDLYMEQGSRGSESGVWVENLIYKNKFYTITHEWPVDSIWGCYKTQNDITAHDLNGILRSSRLVGLENIDRVPMNHFRTTCLSETRWGAPPYTPLSSLDVFSDIYVRPGRPNQFERWLQFGDGVGLDPQRDEWFFFDEWNHHPDDIQLPLLCKLFPLPVLQEPCSNLESLSE